MRDERAHPFGKGTVLTFDCGRRIFAAEILLERLVAIAELHRTETLLRARDQETAERRIDDRERNRRALRAAAILRRSHPSSRRRLLVHAAARSITGVVHSAGERLPGP